MLPGCSQPPRTSNPTPRVTDRSLAPLFGVEYAEPGDRTAILLAATRPWGPDDQVEVAADGEPITSKLQRLRLVPRAGGASWTADPGDWALEPIPTEGVAAGESLVAITDPLPRGAESIDLNGAAIVVRPPTDKGWPIGKSELRPKAPTAELVGAMANDPFRAWRVQLASALAGAKAPAGVRGDLGLLMEQGSARWRAALARVTEEDASLAARLAGGLARVVALPGGRGAPAWSEDLARLHRLLETLGDEGAPPADIRAAAETWLVDEPTAVAWVIDDGDAQRPAQFGVANLTTTPTTASVEAGGRVELAPAPALSALTLTLAMPIGAPSQRVTALVGKTRFDLDVVTAPIPCSPPGVRMGPFLPDWSMAEWIGESAPGLDPRWATAALLAPASNGDGWEIYLDCRAAADGADLVRFVAGDPGAPDGELTASRDGTIEGKGSLRGSTGRITGEADRWTAIVRLPAGSLAGPVTALGIERIDARGVRSRWPRRATPWQEAMSAAAVDLSAWGGARSESREAP